MKLRDKNVVITGAGQGIGYALAVRCVQEGARVAVADVRAESVLRVHGELGPPHVVARCDVANAEELSTFLAQVESDLGPVDVFVANAGIAGGGDPITTPDACWYQVFDVNILAHVRAVRTLLPGWLNRGQGYFVSVASAAGLLTQIGSAPYAVSKHAAVGFAEWLSITYGNKGIGVSCVCPMGVRTAMLEPGEEGALGEIGALAVRDAGAILEPERVADLIIEAVDEEHFLVLPHPEVLTYMQRKAGDPERWLAGMRRLQDAACQTLETKRLD